MDENSTIAMNNNEFEEREKENFNKPSILQVGLLFSFVVIIFLFIGTRVQLWDVNYGVLITEFFLILVPPILFLRIFKFDIKKVLRLNNPGITNLLLIFGIILFSLPVIGVLNLLNFWIIKMIFGKFEVFQAPVSTGSWGLLIGVFVIGVSAGICEELLFRGFIQRGFERFGAVKSIFITAFLFGLMHMDFQRFLGTFVLGALLGFLVYKSNSLISGMFAHFVNNSIAVCITYASLKANELLQNSKMEGLGNVQSGDVFEMFKNFSPAELIGALVVYFILFAFSIAWLVILLRFFIKNNSKREVVLKKEEKKTPLVHFIAFLPGLGLIGFIYVMDILRMGGVIDQATIEGIMHFIGL